MPELATFAIGSFWGAETVFGGFGSKVRVGYVGGSTPDPTFEEVATNATGHVEAVELTLEPDTMFTFEWLLERLFWIVHDPTAVDRFDPDSCGALRSVIFFHSPEQEAIARTSFAEKQKHSSRPLRTQILPATTFWPAEPEHQHRLEDRGAIASHVAVQTPDVAAKMRGPKLPAHDRRAVFDDERNELIDEFGDGFRAYCSAEFLRMTLLQDDAHYGAAQRALRRWTGRHEHVQARRELDGVKVVALLASAQSELRVAGRGTDLTFLVNHRPGNFGPWAFRGDAVYAETKASAHPDDPVRTIYPCGGGRGGYAVDPGITKLVGGTAGPLPADATVAPDAWYRHLPDVEIDPGCGGTQAHPVRWSRGELIVDLEETERERTLAALAGKRCGCLLMQDAFEHRWLFPACGERGITSSFRSMFEGGAVSPRSGSVAGWPTEQQRQKQVERLRQMGETPLPAPEGAAALPSRVRNVEWGRMWNVLQLLPLSVQLRWLLGVLVELDGRLGELDRFERLQVQKVVLAPFRRYVVAALWQWCRCDPSIHYGEIDCRLLEAGEDAWAEGEVDGDRALITAAISMKWLTEVWARDMAVIDDHLVLHAGGSRSDDEVECRVASWVEGADGETARLETRIAAARWDGMHWELA